jgi:very-short-patch-repair endonuclease
VETGRLFRIYRGVYAVGHPELTDHGRWKAATLAVPNSVLSHRSAAELWRLLRPNGADPHITVPYPASPAPRKGMRIHRSRTLDRTTSRDGIPVTMPARTLADLARVATPAEVRRATREAEARGLPLDCGHVPTRTRSDLEDDFFELCRRHHVPLPEKNVPIGRFEVDFLWRPERLIAEADGYLYHRGRQAFRDDRTRDVDLELLGFRVVRFDDSRIAEDPAAVARDLLSLLVKGAR